MSAVVSQCFKSVMGVSLDFWPCTSITTAIGMIFLDNAV